MEEPGFTVSFLEPGIARPLFPHALLPVFETLNIPSQLIYHLWIGSVAPILLSNLQLLKFFSHRNGKYCFVLVFEAKALKLSDFEKRQEKFASFFGPGIAAEVGKSEDNLYEVRLISNTNPNASP
uniref:Uncharacterized protein n=1 Tax=Quercus lobata TaxID=97700 RepID=A0A7N2KXK1_QUELO